MRRLALDHLTAVDASPIVLAQAARAAGCSAICLFMEPMEVLPLMPHFDLYGDRAARQALKTAMDDLAIEFDVAYPFTLTARSEPSVFARAMDCAAELGARMLNVLVYDRDAHRREDAFAGFCQAAHDRGLRAVVEFYPASQIRSLDEAMALVTSAGSADRAGVNVDLLHLARSGGSLSDLARAPAERIAYAQLCDAPCAAPADPELEASAERLPVGEGELDIAGFVRVLPPGCPISVEIPRNQAVRQGVSLPDRVAQAVAGVRRIIG